MHGARFVTLDTTPTQMMVMIMVMMMMLTMVMNCKGLDSSKQIQLSLFLHKAI